MKLSKKFFLIGTLCVVLVAATLGGFAIASADDEDAAPPRITQTNIMEKVAEIYEQNTGTAIDPDELQKAFDEARDATMTETRDDFLQRLVDDGKITQEQADAWKAWMDARPDPFSDDFKAWLESRPDIPELFGPRDSGMMPFGGEHRGFSDEGGIKKFEFRHCPPDNSEE